MPKTVRKKIKKTLDRLKQKEYNKDRNKESKQKEREEHKMMYTVCFFDEATFDDMAVFTGTLADCKAYKGTDDELYVVAPDGFTVVA